MKTKRKERSNTKHKGTTGEGALETVARTIGATLGSISAGTTTRVSRASRAARKLTAGGILGNTKRKGELKKPARRKTVRRAATHKRRRPGSKA
jgi:hypothetical protein